MIRVGIDLGANSIRLLTLEDGVVFDEPCMIALDSSDHVLAIGNEAQEMKGLHDSDIRVISPISYSEVDIHALELLLEQLCYQFKVFRLFKKTLILISYPSSLSDEACEDIKDSLLQLGAYQVFFDKEIWFAALGSKLNLSLPIASCIMNIGSSNCDIAVFSNGQMIDYAKGKFTGNYLTAYLRSWLQKAKSVTVTDQTIEQLIRTLGSVLQETEPVEMPISGFDVKTRTLKTVKVSENELSFLFEPLLDSLCIWIVAFLNQLPQNAQKDIVNRGIVCSGGLMTLKGMRKQMQKKIGCPIYITDDPIYAIIHGMEIVLKQLEI